MITASALRVVNPTIQSLWDRCEDETNFSKTDLAGDRRFAVLADARFKAYRIFRNAGFYITAIGEQFNSHHSTVSHGLEREQINEHQRNI